jgi:hypothetical protein
MHLLDVLIALSVGVLLGIFVGRRTSLDRVRCQELEAELAGRRAEANRYREEVAAHLMRVTETAHWLEWQDWADPVLAEPFALRDGQLHVPDRPGNGIEWNETAVARFAL